MIIDLSNTTTPNTTEKEPCTIKDPPRTKSRGPKTHPFTQRLVYKLLKEKYGPNSLFSHSEYREAMSVPSPESIDYSHLAETLRVDVQQRMTSTKIPSPKIQPTIQRIADERAYSGFNKDYFIEHLDRKLPAALSGPDLETWQDISELTSSWFSQIKYIDHCSTSVDNIFETPSDHIDEYEVIMGEMPDTEYADGTVPSMKHKPGSITLKTAPPSDSGMNLYWGTKFGCIVDGTILVKQSDRPQSVKHEHDAKRSAEQILGAGKWENLTAQGRVLTDRFLHNGKQSRTKSKIFDAKQWKTMTELYNNGKYQEVIDLACRCLSPERSKYIDGRTDKTSFAFVPFDKIVRETEK